MKVKEFKDLKVKFNGLESIDKNYSESFQDIFVLQCFNGKKNGTYLEIGAGNPISGNNTYLLSDKFGWEGLSIDYGYDDWNDDVVIFKQIDELKEQHRQLDIQIQMLSGSGEDEMTLARLKKRKLQLRDQIQTLEFEIYPDQPA